MILLFFIDIRTLGVIFANNENYNLLFRLILYSGFDFVFWK